MIPRRALILLAGLAACGRRRRGGFRGFAFVANQEGQAVAALDLEALAVVRHIRVEGDPAEVLLDRRRPRVYVLTPSSGVVHEIDADKLAVVGQLAVGPAAVSMRSAPDGGALYVISRDLSRVRLDALRLDWGLPLPSAPVDFEISPDGRRAALSLQGAVVLADLAERRLNLPLASGGDYGAVRFLSDGKTLIVADRGQRRLSLYDVTSTRLITHLPLAVRPDNLCFNADGGQLFVTGEGMDAVVVVYPYHTPQVAETVLAGRAPGAMAASVSPAFLFVANPPSGDVSILNIPTRKVIAVVSVGADPGYITVTPDDQYVLVLNRRSGDVAVLRSGAITPNRYKSAALLTVIPVGSKPVAAAIRAL